MDEIVTRPFYPPLTRWQHAGLDVEAALAEHPAIRKLPENERPRLNCIPECIQVFSHGAEYCLDDPRWWVRMNHRRARVLADFLVDGIRAAIREHRARERSAR